MLIQFNFKNHKAFRNDTSLDMMATSLKEHAYNLIDANNGEKLLKIAAIYGANASGKSTVIHAIAFMSSFVLNSFKNSTSHREIPLKRFAFDKESKEKPTEFEVFISYKGNEYQYGFKLDEKRVIEEWLYKRDFRSKNTPKYKCLFEREGRKITCDTQLKGANSLVMLTEDNTLFLSISANAKIPYVKDVMEWFQKIIIVDMGDCEVEAYVTRGLPNFIDREEYQEEVVKFLNAIDIDIKKIEIKRVNVEGEENRYRIYSYHKNRNTDELVGIPFSEESRGTQKMFALYGMFKEAIEMGIPIFIDELDAKLHPLLLKYILTMFHSEESNRKGAQLIYTAHDNYTLNKETFRRDEIWFVEKDEESVANLYSLAEYKIDDKKVRNDASYNKDYLAGKYGAIPMLNPIELWGDE